MIIHKNSNRIPWYLYTGLITLMFVVFTCLYVSQKRGALSQWKASINSQVQETIPIHQLIPGLWQILY